MRKKNYYSNIIKYYRKVWFNSQSILPLAFTLNAVLAMQIPHQLEGKQKSMDLFVTFLKEHNLWGRVSNRKIYKIEYKILT